MDKEMDRTAPGVCLLCFASEEKLQSRQIEDKDLKTIEYLLGVPVIFFVNSHKSHYLMIVPHFQVHQGDCIPQSICSYCETHLESARILRERIKFTQSVWLLYADHSNGIDSICPIDYDQNVQISCHECGVVLGYSELVVHVSSEHGADHLPECKLCSVLLRTGASSGVLFSEIILEG